MKLNQIIAVEKGIKAKVQSNIDAIYKAIQKPAAFDGQTKTYKKKAEEDEDVPATKQNVQIVAPVALRDIANQWVELYDVTIQKDLANAGAKADVKVGEQVLLKEAPVTYLLFLEKQLTDLYTIVSKFPTLDPAEVWTLDPTTGLHRTEPTLTTRTKKVQRGLVLHPPTVEHPAQTQLITEDVSVGTWETTRYSGALTGNEHRKLLARIMQLQNAVKAAREEANNVVAPQIAAGEVIFNWILS